MVTTAYPRLPVNAPARPQDYIFSSTVDQKFTLSTKLELEDGRIFRYFKNGAAILYKALMGQAPIKVAGWSEEVQTGKAASVGDTSYSALVSTAATVDCWAEGWMLAQDVTAAALGDMYKIASNTAHATAPVVQIADAGGIRTALVAATEITFVPNRRNGVIASVAAANTGMAVGVPLVDVPVSYYGWLQTRGECPLIIDTDAVVVGQPVGETATANVAGGGGIVANDGTLPVWGLVRYIGTTGVTDEPAIVDLTLE